MVSASHKKPPKNEIAGSKFFKLKDNSSLKNRAENWLKNLNNLGNFKKTKQFA